MPHLTLFERIRIVKLFNDLPYGIRAKYDRISKQDKDRYRIQISESGVRRLINKWHNTETLADRPRENKSKCLISKGGILAINNAASTRNISRYIKYCQIVSPVNRVKRFIFCCMSKLHNEQFDDVIDIDECTVELRQFTYKNWNKPSANLLRAHGGKVGKPKHNLKLHLFGGISRKGLTPLVIFTGIMYSKDFQK